MKRTPSPWLLLLTGMALIVLANMRWGIWPLAWVAAVPFLHYLRTTRGWKSRALLFTAVTFAWIVAVAKIVTGEIPLILAVPLGGVVGVFQALPLLAWDTLRRRAGLEGWRSVLVFPALAAAGEWAQGILSPLGSWGAAAHTQLHDLALLQLAAVVGTAGVGFVVYWVAAAVEHGLATKGWRPLATAAVAVLGVHVFGAARLAVAEGDRGTALVAAVGTDATFSGPPLPSAAEIRRIDDTLFARTRQAARAGARLVVWNEASTIVDRDQVDAFQAEAAAVASQERIELFVAYIQPAGPNGAVFPYLNQYVWFRPDGSIGDVYRKRFPVPGEPAIAGTTPARVLATEVGRVTGAICYDYDFPAIGLAAARQGADLVVVPSSDWRGIDPLHTEMAILRSIEGGFTTLRSTRMGLSAAIDPYGRVLGALSANDSAARVLIAAVPTRALFTPYGVVGDLLVYLGLAWVVVCLARSVVKPRPALYSAA